MKQDFYPSEDIEIAVILNRCLVNRDADEALLAFCKFLKHHNLKVSQDLIAQIPAKPTLVSKD
ncbi:hypothetical protein [Lentilitoribacter sp. EG35]|uniref:hypothetical protein n=1 Tax=Lentilitoribacter sp. EG35 TaxID=3234192 RepID=UPI003460D820